MNDTYLKARTGSSMATRTIGRGVAALAVVLVAGLAAPSWAQSRTIDDATGRDLWSYPRHPSVDYTHMKLNVLIPDMNTRRMEVVQELTFKPLAGETDHLRLDAKLMKIRSVTSSSGAVTFAHDGQKLDISFEKPVVAGESCTITTTYTVNRASLGLSWTPESPAWPGRPAQLHSKGEPEQNSYWFPCHDFPNDGLASE